jgi:hypothetical protein
MKYILFITFLLIANPVFALVTTRATVPLTDENRYTTLKSNPTYGITNHLPDSPDADIRQIVYNYGGQEYLDICICESQCGLYLTNSQSSARGLFQMIDKTWEHYCTGDVMNNLDNLNCFHKLYPLYPNWWSECLNK